MSMTRRSFVQLAAAGVVHGAAFSSTRDLPAATPNLSQRRISSFEGSGVTLLAGRLRSQFLATRDFYLHLPDDDILKGFRKTAGLSAPGDEMGGWAEKDTSAIFGQWLSGMARTYRATGDVAMRDKAITLMGEWGKTFAKSGQPSSGKAATSHYTFDKTLCGLVDLSLYADCKEASSWTEQLVDWGIKNLNRQRPLPNVLLDPSLNRPVNTSGPTDLGIEWYTLSENLYRAYLLTNEAKYKQFAEMWHYPQYWGKFAQVEGDPARMRSVDIHGLHAYSHVNTLSSAAMAYAVQGDPQFLNVITGAFDVFQKHQNFASGGFGPVEQLVKPDGSLGLSLEYEACSFETVCGSWAVFKLCKYLLEFTGDARYGDWMEQVLYNGISAALPMADKDNPYFDDIWTMHGWGPDRGRTFYYSDYRLGGARKEYYISCWPCCSGTYLQNVAEYHSLIYFHDEHSLYVNLFLASELQWSYQRQQILVRQETSYPEEETTRIKFHMPRSARFDLHLRIPQWVDEVILKVNHAQVPIKTRSKNWAVLQRTWVDGDEIEFTIPMRMRALPVDQQHPQRIALASGPVVLVQEQRPTLRLAVEDPQKGFTPGDAPLHFVENGTAKAELKPFYRTGYAVPYSMYFDI